MKHYRVVAFWVTDNQFCHNFDYFEQQVAVVLVARRRIVAALADKVENIDRRQVGMPRYYPLP